MKSISTDVKESKQQRANQSTMSQTLKQTATETKRSGKDSLYPDLRLMILDWKRNENITLITQ